MRLLRDILLCAALVFAVSAPVTFLWGSAFEDRAAVDWPTAGTLAVILGLALPLARRFRRAR